MMAEMDIHMLQMKCNFLTLGNTGIHPNQIAVLAAMQKLGPSTQRMLAKELRCSPASVGVSVKRMERAGLVKKHAAKDDLRSSRVMLTPKGVEMGAYCERVFAGLAKRKYEGFSDEEMAILNAFLDRMTANLERYQEELASDKKGRNRD